MVSTLAESFPGVRRDPRSLRRPVFGAVLTFLLVALGVWGVVADRSEPAGVGNTVGMDGGSLRVDDAWVLGDPMSGMHSGQNQFANMGMSMGQMLPDAVPEGMKRVAIQVHFNADSNQTLLFPSQDFFLSIGGERFGTYRSLLGDEQLSPGDQLIGVLVFEIPSAAMTSMLESPRLDRAFRIGFGPGGSHGHQE